jgi:hypothetical protein
MITHRSAISMIIAILKAFYAYDSHLIFSIQIIWVFGSLPEHHIHALDTGDITGMHRKKDEFLKLFYRF